MDYRCRECDVRIDPGTAICVCGNVFSAPVPPDTGEPGVTKWPPPPPPQGLQRGVETASSTWEQLSDTTKAILAGVVVILLIGLAVLINHHK